MALQQCAHADWPAADFIVGNSERVCAVDACQHQDAPKLGTAPPQPDWPGCCIAQDRIDRAGCGSQNVARLISKLAGPPRFKRERFLIYP